MNLETNEPYVKPVWENGKSQEAGLQPKNHFL